MTQLMNKPITQSATRYTYRLPLFLLILGVAIALRSWQLPTLPPGFHLDESFEGLEAWRILTDPSYRPLFLRGNFGVPPLNSYLNAAMFQLYQWLGGEPGPLAMRTTAALLGVLGVIALYGVALELRQFAPLQTNDETTSRCQSLLSPAFPLFAMATLAVMRWHIHFSRMGIEPIFVPLVWATSTALLLRGWRTQRWWYFVASGVVLGGGMYTYRGAWVIPLLFVLVALILLLTTWRQQTLSPQRWVGIVLCGVMAALVFVPLGLLFWREPQLLLLRLNQLNIVGETGSPADNSVGSSLLALSKMFGPFGTPGDADPRRNLPGAPALNVWLSIPFYLGLALSLWRIRRPAYAIILVSLLGLLSVNIISEYAPHFHRILGAAAPTALLCAIGLDQLWQWTPLRRLKLHWVALLLLVLGGGVGARNYFVRWAQLPDLYYAFDVGLWQIGQDAAAQPPDTPVYLTPRTWEHPTLAFAWEALAERTDRPISFDGRHIFPATEPIAPAAERYIVITHEDFRTPLLLPEVLPDATVEQRLTDAQGNLYAAYYLRPVDSLTARPPQHSLPQTLGDGIDLVGYDVQPAELKAGAILYLQLHWSVTAQPTTNWTVFTHLLTSDDSGSQRLVAGRDDLPGGGSLPTVVWHAGWRILDEYQIQLPADLPAGEYQLSTGLYDPNGNRLPAETGEVVLGSVLIASE